GVNEGLRLIVAGCGLFGIDGCVIDRRVEGGTVVLNDLRGTVAPEPIVKGMADDGQEPCACIASVQRSDILERPYASILNDIIGVDCVACEPAGQVVRRVQMRQAQLLEATIVGQTESRG